MLVDLELTPDNFEKLGEGNLKYIGCQYDPALRFKNFAIGDDLKVSCGEEQPLFYRVGSVMITGSTVVARNWVERSGIPQSGLFAYESTASRPFPIGSMVIVMGLVDSHGVDQ